MPEDVQEGESTVADWKLCTVWSAGFVRVWTLAQRLEDDRAMQVSAVDLNVDAHPEEVWRLGITMVPSLVLMKTGSKAARLTGEVGWLELEQ